MPPSIVDPMRTIIHTFAGMHDCMVPCELQGVSFDEIVRNCRGSLQNFGSQSIMQVPLDRKAYGIAERPAYWAWDASGRTYTDHPKQKPASAAEVKPWDSKKARQNIYLKPWATDHRIESQGYIIYRCTNRLRDEYR